MNMKQLAFLVCLSLLAPNAVAQNGADNLKQAVAKAKKKTGGQVLSTSEKTVDGQRVFRIKVLDKNGVVRYVDVKAKP
jgi:uncharacterized membrane protein YkoI